MTFIDEDWLKLLERIRWLGKDAIRELFYNAYCKCKCLNILGKFTVCKTCQIAIDFEFV